MNESNDFCVEFINLIQNEFERIERIVFQD